MGQVARFSLLPKNVLWQLRARQRTPHKLGPPGYQRRWVEVPPKKRLIDNKALDLNFQRRLKRPMKV